MIRLNLPSFEIKLSGTKEQPRIFDILRHRYVALTPEEWVRQHFVHYLIEHKGYPAALMANEMSLCIGNKKLRADSVLYNRHLQPRMIMEYKAPTVEITQKVFEQIAAYNLLLHVDYLVVSNGLQHYCCRIDYDKRTYDFLQDIPTYESIAGTVFAHKKPYSCRAKPKRKSSASERRLIGRRTQSDRTADGVGADRVRCPMTYRRQNNDISQAEQR